jgi:hypothetical protein
MDNFSRPSSATNILLGITACGVWLIFLQNMGVIPVVQKVDNLHWSSFHMPDEIKVKGKVSIDNTVDMNIKSINGHESFYNSDRDPNTYCRLPVYSGN